MDAAKRDALARALANALLSLKRDHAFDEIRESIDHTQALLEALAEATGDTEVVRMNNEPRQESQSAQGLV